MKKKLFPGGVKDYFVGKVTKKGVTTLSLFRRVLVKAGRIRLLDTYEVQRITGHGHKWVKAPKGYSKLSVYISGVGARIRARDELAFYKDLVKSS